MHDIGKDMSSPKATHGARRAKKGAVQISSTANAHAPVRHVSSLSSEKKGVSSRNASRRLTALFWKKPRSWREVLDLKISILYLLERK